MRQPLYGYGLTYCSLGGPHSPRTSAILISSLAAASKPTALGPASHRLSQSSLLTFRPGGCIRRWALTHDALSPSRSQPLPIRPAPPTLSRCIIPPLCSSLSVRRFRPSKTAAPSPRAPSPSRSLLCLALPRVLAPSPCRCPPPPPGGRLLASHRFGVRRLAHFRHRRRRLNVIPTPHRPLLTMAALVLAAICVLA